MYEIKEDNVGGMKLRSTPLSFDNNGYYSYEKGAILNSTVVSYWSSTAYSAYESRSPWFLESGSFATQGVNFRGNGYALRCVAR